MGTPWLLIEEWKRYVAGPLLSLFISKMMVIDIKKPVGRRTQEYPRAGNHCVLDHNFHAVDLYPVMQVLAYIFSRV